MNQTSARHSRALKASVKPTIGQATQWLVSMGDVAASLMCNESFVDCIHPCIQPNDEDPNSNVDAGNADDNSRYVDAQGLLTSRKNEKYVTCTRISRTLRKQILCLFMNYSERHRVPRNVIFMASTLFENAMNNLCNEELHFNRGETIFKDNEATRIARAARSVISFSLAVKWESSEKALSNAAVANMLHNIFGIYLNRSDYRYLTETEFGMLSDIDYRRPTTAFEASLLWAGLLNMRSLEKFTNDVVFTPVNFDELPITPRPGESGPEPKRRKTESYAKSPCEGARQMVEITVDEALQMDCLGERLTCMCIILSRKGLQTDVSVTLIGGILLRLCLRNQKRIGWQLAFRLENQISMLYGLSARQIHLLCKTMRDMLEQ